MNHHYDDITNKYYNLLVSRYARGIIDYDKCLRFVAKLDEWNRVAGERGLPISYYGGDRD